jgi:RNA polymerase sigma factor (TIGR02999 family)
MSGGANEVTQLLQDAQRGDRDAVDRLLPLVYAELRRVAARQLRREREGHTLQPTALVHEAYLELVGQRELAWQSRAHFIGIAAHLMRQILVRNARRRGAAKRAGGLVQVPLDDAMPRAAGEDVDVVALHEALETLAAKDARLARIVELRYFGGLTIEETAEVIEVGTATVEREWRAARAWLRRELDGAQGAR